MVCGTMRVKISHMHSMKVKRTWFEVVECNCIHMRVLRVCELENTRFK